MKTFMAMLFIALWIIPAQSREQYPGQYAQGDPWWGNQRHPKTNNPCCSIADGTYAEEEIRNGHFWTRWKKVGSDEMTPWVEVPDDAVIYNSKSPQGHPVVWYGSAAQSNTITYFVLCYVPGTQV